MDPRTAARIEQDWSRLTGSGWRHLTLRRGAWMGLGIGLPVGLLRAATMSAADLPPGGRPVTFLAFVAVTLAWTIPISFLLRWFTVREYRRLARTVSSPAPLT